MDDTAPEDSDWARAVLADSEAALRELCATVEEALAEPDPLAIPGVTALLTAVVGATALADERTHEIIASLPSDGSRDDADAPDGGVLTQFGEAVLERFRHTGGSVD